MSNSVTRGWVLFVFMKHISAFELMCTCVQYPQRGALDRLCGCVWYQHWDLTFVKSRLEHKFCAWHHARLARLDAVHALLLVVLSSTSMLWPLRSAGTVLPVVPFGVQGEMRPPRACGLQAEGESPRIAIIAYFWTTMH